MPGLEAGADSHPLVLPGTEKADWDDSAQPLPWVFSIFFSLFASSREQVGAGTA